MKEMPFTLVITAVVEWAAKTGGMAIARAIRAAAPVLVLVFVSLTSGAACAAPDDGVVTVGEVVVTAEKRVEKLEVTPVAVSPYGGEERIVHGIDSIQDLASRTPGFEYSVSADRAYIRGVGREGDNVATDPGVATYVDGVYNASVAAAVGDSLFVDHLEVLRGPARHALRTKRDRRRDQRDHVAPNGSSLCGNQGDRGQL